jgi:hypothetical protein
MNEFIMKEVVETGPSSLIFTISIESQSVHLFAPSQVLNNTSFTQLKAF